jgi:hypothetical protein
MGIHPKRHSISTISTVRSATKALPSDKPQAHQIRGHSQPLNGRHLAPTASYLEHLLAAYEADPAPVETPPAPTSDELLRATRDSVRELMMIRAYRARGHPHANLDPLGLEKMPRPGPRRCRGVTNARLLAKDGAAPCDQKTNGRR